MHFEGVFMYIYQINKSLCRYTPLVAFLMSPDWRPQGPQPAPVLNIIKCTLYFLNMSLAAVKLPFVPHLGIDKLVSVFPIPEPYGPAGYELAGG